MRGAAASHQRGAASRVHDGGLTTPVSFPTKLPHSSADTSSGNPSEKNRCKRTDDPSGHPTLKRIDRLENTRQISIKSGSGNLPYFKGLLDSLSSTRVEAEKRITCQAILPVHFEQAIPLD